MDRKSTIARVLLGVSSIVFIVSGVAVLAEGEFVRGIPSLLLGVGIGLSAVVPKRGRLLRGIQWTLGIAALLLIVGGMARLWAA